jgi:hypothetical protein
MAAKQRAHNAQQDAEAMKRAKSERDTKLLGDRLFTETGSTPGLRRVQHPGALESLIPVWGPAKEMGADLDDGNFAGAAVNFGIAAADMYSGGIANGGLRLSGPFKWRSKPGEPAGMRKWMGETGFPQKGQPAHHGWLEQASKAPSGLRTSLPS